MTTYRVTVTFPAIADQGGDETYLVDDETVPHVVERRREFGALILVDVDGVEHGYARGRWDEYLMIPEPLDAREVRRVAQLAGAAPTPASIYAARRMP